MMSVQLVDTSLLTPIIDKAIDNGVLIDYFLFDNESFRIAPPLIITPDQIREGVEKILNAMDSVMTNNLKKI